MNQINRREAKYFIFSAAYSEALGSIQTPVRIKKLIPGDKGTGSDNFHSILLPGLSVAEGKV
jgi:hypothetical protein